jgi:hypothetical protein
MLRISLFVALILVLVVGACTAEVNDISWIYRGQPAAKEGIKLSGWGSGKAVDTIKMSMEGSNSIEMSSTGLYSGGKIEWNNPVSLPVSAFNYIQFIIYFPESKVINVAGVQADWYNIEPYLVPVVDQMRMIFVADDGTQTSYLCYTNPIDSDDNWMRLYVPMSKLKMPAGATEYKLKKVMLFTIYKTNFYLGQIKLVEDSGKIQAAPLSSQSIAAGDTLFYQADCVAGASTLRYSWSWGDGSAPENDTSNRVGKHLYAKGGDFKVSLTISDAAGIKSPSTVTTSVYVSDAESEAAGEY